LVLSIAQTIFFAGDGRYFALILTNENCSFQTFTEKMGGGSKKRKQSKNQDYVPNNPEHEANTGLNAISGTYSGPRKLSLRFGGFIHEEHKMV
jgi:hypothetical protein